MWQGYETGSRGTWQDPDDAREYDRRNIELPGGFRAAQRLRHCAGETLVSLATLEAPG